MFNLREVAFELFAVFSQVANVDEDIPAEESEARKRREFLARRPSYR